jgi:hypothetical protein
MFSNITNSVAGAKCSAMETETIQKNGVSRKYLQTSRINLLFAGIFTVIVVFLFSSCVTHHSNLLKADLIGFNDSITPSYHYTNKCLFKKLRKQSEPYNLNSSSENKQMQLAVFKLKQGKQTSAYYALDNALDRIEYVQKKCIEHDPSTKFYIVMLTDGLDNNSVSLRNNNRCLFSKKYEDGNAGKEAYASYLNRRMNSIMKKYCFFNLFKGKNTTNQFKSFVLYFKGGSDISSSDYTEAELSKILTPYTAAQNADRVPAPIIGSNFEELLAKFENELLSNDFSFRIPRQYVGEKIRMYLDKEKDIYIEGAFEKDSKGYFWLSNITTSKGLTMKYNSAYMGSSSTKNTFVTATLRDLKLDNKPYKVNRQETEQWYTDMGKLRLNSEYTSNTDTKKNAYLIVLLDASLSFANNYKEAQNTILKIVEMVSNAE